MYYCLHKWGINPTPIQHIRLCYVDGSGPVSPMAYNGFSFSSLRYEKKNSRFASITAITVFERPRESDRMHLRASSASDSCIYRRRCSSEPFPAEHVIPKSFALFRNGLTLHCVCGDCNQFFGTHLELHFGRETGESVVRFQYGLRDSVAGSPGCRLTGRIKVPGPTFGAKVLLYTAS
jgi:hypothetical protein